MLDEEDFGVVLPSTCDVSVEAESLRARDACSEEEGLSKFCRRAAGGGGTIRFWVESTAVNSCTGRPGATSASCEGECDSAPARGVGRDFSVWRLESGDTVSVKVNAAVEAPESDCIDVVDSVELETGIVCGACDPSDFPCLCIGGGGANF